MFRNLSKTSILYPVGLCYIPHQQGVPFTRAIYNQCGLGSPLRKACHSDTANFAPEKRTKHLLYPFHTIFNSPLTLNRNNACCKQIAVIEETTDSQTPERRVC